MSDTVIQVKNLAKRYRLGTLRKAGTFSEEFLHIIKAPINNFKRVTNLSRFKDEDEAVFWALRDVNFEVKRGEVLGVIGHNGAGKSTLLKILSRITDPTTGEISITGRVSSLLEVGTGFHPELTGRENIYMNGTILGMRKKEIDRKLDEIIAFSGVEKHIDTPVKFYSSGMKVRLGFSVAAHLEPEILIIDEVLAVGDFEFQKKCLGKMESVSKSGRTVIFVSHNLESVSSLCTRAILLTQGSLTKEGQTDEVLGEYMKRFSSVRTEFVEDDTAVLVEEVFLKRAFLSDAVGGAKNIFSFTEGIYLNLEFFAKSDLDVDVSFAILSSSNIVVLNSNKDDAGLDQRLEQGENHFTIAIPGSLLNSGAYFCRVFVVERKSKRLIQRKDVLDFKIDLNGIYKNAEKRNALVIPCLSWLRA